MSIEALVAVAIPGLFTLFLVAERMLQTGRTFAWPRGWTLLGYLGLLVSGAANALFPLFMVPALQKAQLVDTAQLGLWMALPTSLLTTFFTYWSHRLQHRYDLLWRLGHQLHHAVARVDISSAMMFHPIDLLFQIGMTTLAASLLGVSAEAAALAGLLNFLIALYQHWNVATPHWTGYILQRPEAHLLHHERNVHSRNFGDLALWDMLFGTYANPHTVDVAVGFEPERARRVLAMLLCVDVNQQVSTAAKGRAAHA